jgi:hypothetical protein
MNWDRVNKKFDEVLNNLSDEDWDNWDKNRESNRLLRREKMNEKLIEMKKEAWIKNVMKIYNFDRVVAELYYKNIQPYK